MRYAVQVTIILTVTFLGELVKQLIPLPVPASIWGLVLMLAALFFKVIRVDQVKETGNFLMENMQLTFLPASVGLMVSWAALQNMLVPFVVILVVSTVVVMVAAGWTTQAVMRLTRRRP